MTSEEEEEMNREGTETLMGNKSGDTKVGDGGVCAAVLWVLWVCR
jgi:hypothetical protein